LLIVLTLISTSGMLTAIEHQHQDDINPLHAGLFLYK
jgi:hypothetical protein